MVSMVGPHTASRECVFGGTHVFSRGLNGLVDDFIRTEVISCKQSPVDGVYALLLKPLKSHDISRCR